MRVRTTLGLVALGASLLAHSSAQTAVHLVSESAIAAKKPFVNGTLKAPDSPNPYLAYMLEGGGDTSSWQAYLTAAGKQRAARQSLRGPRDHVLHVMEREPANVIGRNDTQAQAERIHAFGTHIGQRSHAAIHGTAPIHEGESLGLAPQEPDGTLATATLAGIGLGDVATASAVVGDGACGTGDDRTSDFDFYSIPAMAEGETLFIDIDTPEPFGPLDSFIAVWDAEGNVLATNDDDGATTDSFLAFTAPESGAYYVSVGGFGAFVPLDPTVPCSPSETGDIGAEGDYSVKLRVVQAEVDFYSFRLRAGDIIGATVNGDALRLAFFAENGSELVGSSQDRSAIYPEASPLPSGGVATLAYVVDRPGRYAISVLSFGGYEIDLQGFRPVLEGTRRGVQKLFLDFDGASVDVGIFFQNPTGTERALDPLSSFMTRWGLTAEDEDEVIDAVLANVEENLSETIRDLGNNGDRHDHHGRPGDFDIVILNSRDNPDVWGMPNVSRVIVGGTSTQVFGRPRPVIGISQSIDVGNFETKDTAVVMLDILSEPNPAHPRFPFSLNSIPLAPSASIIDLIGDGVGNFVAHEAGHFFANWHTDSFNAAANIMDQGGNFAQGLGLGPDLIFGTADDVDVDYGRDVYVPNEGFTGMEDTLQSISFGLSTGWKHGHHH